MTQKYKQLVFEDYNLAINNSTCDYKAEGLASRLKNVECKNASIKSACMLGDLFEVLAPNRVESAKQVFTNTIGACKWISGYQFFKNNKQVEYAVFCNLENKIFYYEIGASNPDFKCLTNVVFSSTPTIDFFIKDGHNIMLLSSPTDSMYVWDGLTEPYQVLDAPKIDSMAVGLERLFVSTTTHPYSVLFSDDMDPSNWCMAADEAGEIVFNDNLGTVLKVCALDNYIYVVRDYGILKLYGYKESENTFNVSRVYASTSKIFKNSIAIAGDRLVFMANDGIYSFDGLSAKRINNKLYGLVFNPDLCRAACKDGIYYLCLNLYENCEKNNALICLDLETKNITNICYGFDFQNLCILSANNALEMVVISSDIVSKNANTPQYICKNRNKNDKNAQFEYLTHFLNLQPHSHNKMLCKLTFLCKTDIKICVETDTQIKEFFVNASDKFQTIKLNLKANIFAIKFYGIGDVDISHIKLDYCFVE